MLIQRRPSCSTTSTLGSAAGWAAEPSTRVRERRSRGLGRFGMARSERVVDHRRHVTDSTSRSGALVWRPRHRQRSPRVCAVTDVPTLARRGVAALRRDGPGYALALAVDLAFERALGIETREYVEVDDAGITGRNRAAHAASSWLPLAKALRAQGDVSGDVFLDYGAGKGRALA